MVDVLREFISDLKEKADYTTLDCYESELEVYNDLCCDLRDMIDNLRGYINDSKKLDRSHILEELRNMEREINNVN